jgi:hypothetical protein
MLFQARPFQWTTYERRLSSSPAAHTSLLEHRLAEVTGVPITTIYKLEARKTTNPKFRHLRNLALAPGIPFDDLLEDDWKSWTVLDARAPEPPDLDELLGPWRHRRA